MWFPKDGVRIVDTNLTEGKDVQDDLFIGCSYMSGFMRNQCYGLRPGPTQTEDG